VVEILDMRLIKAEGAEGAILLENSSSHELRASIEVVCNECEHINGVVTAENEDNGVVAYTNCLEIKEVVPLHDVQYRHCDNGQSSDKKGIQ
jgi:hypothetical protein